MNGKIFDKQELTKLIKGSEKFYSKPESNDFINNLIKTYLSTLQNNSTINKEIIANISIGYPFYYQNHKGLLSEIKSFHEKILTQIEKSKISNDRWKCIECQKRRELPDYKKYCKPCTEVEFKPRDIMKILPDIDLFLLVNNADNTELQNSIKEVSFENRFFSSDISIENTLKETYNTFFNENDRIPLDFHLLDKEETIKFLKNISENNGKLNEITYVWALYNGWKKTDIPLSFDLLFSSKIDFLQKDDEFKYELFKFYETIFKKKIKNFDDYINTLSALSSRASKLVKDKNILEELKQRYDKLSQLKTLNDML